MPIAKPAPLLSDLVHFQTDLRVVGRMLAPHGLGIDTDQDTDPALRDRMTLRRSQHCIPPLHRRRQGFPSRSFRTTLSNMTSATRRFSLALAIGLEPMAPLWLDFLKLFQASGVR
jgi:hypothetical protein